MLSILQLYGMVIPVILAILFALWAISVLIEDSSIIDIFWGPGFVVISFVCLIVQDDAIVARQWLIHILVTLWGLRLGGYLFYRNAGHGEDARYQRWRADAGPGWWYISAWRVYGLQGAIMLVVALPLITVHAAPEQGALSTLDWIAAGIWLAAFILEAGADQQLQMFKSQPENQGRTLDSGFWSINAHPNYLGDAIQWWAIWLIAIGAPLGFWSFIGPLAMSLVLSRISSRLLESALRRRREGYGDYITRTGGFLPRFGRQQRKPTP